MNETTATWQRWNLLAMMRDLRETYDFRPDRGDVAWWWETYYRGSRHHGFSQEIQNAVDESQGA